MIDIVDADSWWQVCKENWPDIKGILQLWLDADEATLASKYFSEGDDRLANLLQRAWGNASEGYARQRVPGWLVLCDLCSEREVLYEQ